MRCLARHVFTLCSAVSLLLCAAVCVLWARSYRTADVLSAPLASEPYLAQSMSPFGYVEEWTKYRNTRAYAISSCGSLSLRWQRFTAGTNPPFAWRTVAPRPLVWSSADEHVASATVRRSFAGFQWCSGARRGGFWLLVVPSWAVAASLGLLPAAALYRGLRARSRRKSGCCPACGYDLRASAERCPECGAAAPAAQ